MLESTDGQRLLDLGGHELTHSILSIVTVHLQSLLPQVPLAVQFLRFGTCAASDAQETARQLNLVRDALAQVSPEDAIWDLNDRTVLPPWTGNLSPIVTSCANLYTTSDGRDLLWELVVLLTYASVVETSVRVID
ncbi:Imm70 family immunity protein [Populibacterium corticicola]